MDTQVEEVQASINGLKLAAMLTGKVSEFYEQQQYQPMMFRPLGDGVHWVEIWPLFGKEYNVCIVRFDKWGVGVTQQDAWEYGWLGGAIQALSDWYDPSGIVGGYFMEPEGWIHHPTTGRRRRGGDAGQEYNPQS